jgi:hypothetical protein
MKIPVAHAFAQRQLLRVVFEGACYSGIAAHPAARAVRSSQGLVRWGFWGRVARVVKRTDIFCFASEVAAQCFELLIARRDLRVFVVGASPDPVCVI